jgi:hypothetical protein
MPTRTKELLLGAAGVLAILAGLGVGWKRTHTAQEGEGVDFAVLHVMAVGIARGADVYDLNEHPERRSNVAGVSYPQGAMGLVVYPPVTGFPLLPLAELPFASAKIVWFVLLHAVLLLGLWSLLRLCAPDRSPGVWLLIAGVVLVSSAVRWGTMLLQGAPIMLGLLCFFVVALHRNRPWLALAIGVIATAFKMTLALPFLGLMLLHRRYLALFASAGTWLALNALGFMRMGATAFAHYQSSVAKFEDPTDATNINSPNPWTGVSLPRLDWAYLFYGVTLSAQLARILSLACSAAVALWLLRAGLRTRQQRDISLATTAAFLLPLVCLGSLCVYHHQYDLCLLFAPLILAYFVLDDRQEPRWAVWLMLPVVLVMLVMPIGAASQWALRFAGAIGVGLLKLTFPVVITMALIGSMALLSRRRS